MMTNIRFIIILLIGLLWSSSFSQNYINYTEKDGLASNLVYRITQDHQGFIWFITDKGISKFDGTTFKNFTREDGLPINEIIRFRVTSDNRFWYFSRSDEFGYIENDSVYHFRANDRISMRPDLGINQFGNSISFLGAKKNYHFKDNLWEARKETRDSFKLLNTEIFYQKDSTKTILKDASGKILFTFKPITSIREAYQVNDSLFGVLTNKGYELFNVNTQQYGSGVFKPSKDYSRVSLDFHWVNNQLQLVAGGDVYFLDENMEVEAVQSAPMQLKSMYCFKDSDGFTWCATTENGVYKLPKDFRNLTSFFNGKSITRISKAKNEIYVGVKSEGIFRIKNDTSKLIIDEPKLSYKIDEVDDIIFYGFGSHYVAEGKKRIKTIVNEDDYYAAGMLKYKGSYFSEGCSMVVQMSNDLKKIDKFKDYEFYQGLFKNNDSLFSFNYNTMLYYDDTKGKFLPYNENEIARELITHATINETTFIGTQGSGMYRFHGGKIRKLVTNDLAVINSIAIEDENSIWVVSEGTLLHYFITEAKEFVKKEYSFLSGYPTNNLTQVFFDNQQLYLGSTTGLTIFDKKDIIETSDFKIYIKNVTLNGKKQAKDSLDYVYSSDLNLNVNFWSMNYYDATNYKYQYRVIPLQNNWTTTVSGEVNLFDLQPDNYTLQLKATHSDTSKILSYPIHVNPRWWQTDLFLVLAVISIAGLLIFLLWNIIKFERAKKLKILIQEKQLAQIQLKALRSQMNPHFVFNSLAAIQYYINENDFQSSEKYLVKFSRLIRTFFELSKENEITIENEVALLVNYLDVEKLRFRDKFDYIIDIDPNLDKWKSKIPTMLLQPIVENAINHGVFNKHDKGNIAIKFKKLDQDELNVSISDDGVGFEKTKKIETVSRTKSSNVLRDRLYYLNKSRFWKIEYSTHEAFPDREDKGNVSTFILKPL